MEQQMIIAKRIRDLCEQQNVSFYELSYKSAVPITTLLHIVDGTVKNPGLFTIGKICGGLGITLKEFFDSKEFVGIEYEGE